MLKQLCLDTWRPEDAKKMQRALKFTRGALLAAAGVTLASLTVSIISFLLSHSLGEVIENASQNIFAILFFGILTAPLFIGYLLVCRDTAGLPSIGFAVGVTPPTLLFVYYQFVPPTGGISAVMTILFIPILAIVSGVFMMVIASIVEVVNERR